MTKGGRSFPVQSGKNRSEIDPGLEVSRLIGLACGNVDEGGVTSDPKSPNLELGFLEGQGDLNFVGFTEEKFLFEAKWEFVLSP